MTARRTKTPETKVIISGWDPATGEERHGVRPDPVKFAKRLEAAYRILGEPVTVRYIGEGGGE